MDIACAPPCTNEVTPIIAPLQKSVPQGISIRTSAAIRASINAAALAGTGSNDDDDNDDNDDGYSFFWELPNPDPEDLLPHDICGDFILLFVGSRKCQKSYSKKRKVDIFYDALTLEKKVILGNSPPQEVKEKLDLWSQAVKQRGKWTLNRITKSVYIIAPHIHNLQEKLCKNRGSVSTDSKVDALVLMYSFFLSEINLAEVVHQLQNKAAAKSLQQQKSKPVKPLPTNFHYNTSKV
jgi:hypothetical protein